MEIVGELLPYKGGGFVRGLAGSVLLDGHADCDHPGRVPRHWRTQRRTQKPVAEFSASQFLAERSHFLRFDLMAWNNRGHDWEIWRKTSGIGIPIPTANSPMLVTVCGSFAPYSTAAR
jgi:hypothetical protein